jgi:phosphatidylglycerophosphatase A
LFRPWFLVATWFGSGLLPKAPGTWGSLAALPFAWVIQTLGGQVALLLAAVAVFFLGWWASERFERESGIKDPGVVVIDEVAGQWLTLAFVPISPLGYALGFALFRVADIVKPWPASLADREMGGGLGIMIDDMIAGAYAGLGLYLGVMIIA